MMSKDILIKFYITFCEFVQQTKTCKFRINDINFHLNKYLIVPELLETPNPR